MAKVDNRGTLRLLIISQSFYDQNKSHCCYLGLDKSQGTIYRPVPSFGPKEADFFWPSINPSVEIGETHEFQVVPGQDPILALLPHCNNDVQVKHIRRIEEKSGVGPNMFRVLQNLSKMSIEEAFGAAGMISNSVKNKPYVKEGENCQSLGVYKCTSEEASKLTFHEQEHILPDNPKKKVLVIIETARPLSGREKFNPRRCYLKEVGVVTEFE